MHARRLLAVTFFGALAACRSIVGVADLELVDGGSGTSSGGPSGDASTADTGGGTDADAGSPLLDADVPDSAATMCRSNGSECRKCCKDTFKSLVQDTEIGNRQCFCTGPGSCTQCASEAYCTATQQPYPAPTPGGQCTPCIDDKLAKGECAETCTSPDCRAGLSCIKNCP